MVRFLVKTLSWTIPGLGACLIIWFGLLHLDPGRDANGYARTLPVQSTSMIFGTSRSAQGINPSVLDVCGPQNEVWFNFSFNLAATPWSKDYSNAIIQKVSCSNTETASSTFLLSVDPWALDELAGSGESSWFKESSYSWCSMSIFKYAVGQTAPLDVFSASSGSDLISTTPVLFREIYTRLNSTQPEELKHGIRENGWLPNLTNQTSDERSQRIQSKVNDYAALQIGETWPGDSNIHGLSQTIDFLLQRPHHPRIILLRVPVTESMLQLENQRFPNFNQILSEYAVRYGIEYIDGNVLCPQISDYLFADGHHLHRIGADEFSACIGNEILKSH